MKRESKTENIPFKENLVFYAPLNEGHLEDKISGVIPTTDSGCSVEWDSEKGMYILESNIVDNTSLKYNVSLINDTLYHTSFFVVNIKNDIGNSWNHYFSIYNNSSMVQYICQAKTHLNKNVEHKVCCVHNNRNRIYYVDNNVVDIATITAASLLSNFVRLCTIQPNNSQLTEWIKDVRIYNRALTAEEVAQL